MVYKISLLIYTLLTLTQYVTLLGKQHRSWCFEITKYFLLIKAHV